MTRRRALRALFIALLVSLGTVALYGLIATFAAPRMAQIALEQAGAASGLIGRAERIHFEPFALAFDIENMQISGPDGALFTPQVRADFGLASLLFARPVLDRVEIRRGSLHGTPRGAFAIASWLGTLARASSIATLEAEIVELALLAESGDETPWSLELHGTALEPYVGNGTLALTATGVVGDGSRLEAQLAAERADAGARLHGTATLTQGSLALGDWMIAAPSARFAIESTLSTTTVAAAISWVSGEITATDARTANARFDLTGDTANAMWNPVAGTFDVEAKALLAGGRATLTAARGANDALQAIAHLDGVSAMALAPYAVRALGVAPANGTISLELSIGSGDRAAPNVARVTTQYLRLAAARSTAAASIALFERPDGTISMDIPLASGRRATEQIVEHVARRVAATAASPFAELAAVIGRSGAQLSAIEFFPGSAEPSATGENTLGALAAALVLRPRVGVRLDAEQRAESDRAALARSQVALHVTLATAQVGQRRGAETIDFASERAQDVLDEFARERLDASALAELRRGFTFDAAASAAVPERVAYYRALFELLVAREPIADTALGRLADFRARVVDRRLGELGIADSRIVESSSPPPSESEALTVLTVALVPAPDAESLP